MHLGCGRGLLHQYVACIDCDVCVLIDLANVPYLRILWRGIF